MEPKLTETSPGLWTVLNEHGRPVFKPRSKESAEILLAKIQRTREGIADRQRRAAPEVNGVGPRPASADA